MLNLFVAYIYSLLVVDAILMTFARMHWIPGISIEFGMQFAVVSAACFVLLLLQGRFGRGVILLTFALFFSWPTLALWYPYSTPPVGQATHASSDDVAEEPEVRLRVMTANVNRRNTQYQLLGGVIGSEKPDVVALEEVTPEWFVALVKAIGPEYKYRVDGSSADYRGMAIFSKVPVSLHEDIQLVSPASPPVLKAVFTRPAFTLYAVHALSPISQRWAHERDAFIGELAAVVATSTGSVMVVGDFNTTEQGPAMQSFIDTANLADARAGKGWQPSWLRSTLVALSLDHILYKGEVQLTDFRVLQDIGSDHRPLIATFTLRSGTRL